MTDFSSITFPTPKDWQAFERAARLLFQYVLNDPNTQNNGRVGQRQHGVDIFGYRGGGGGPLVGVQCKGKDNDYGAAVTINELEAEVRKTERFRPELREFILATTAPDDAPLQEAARLLEQKIRGEGRILSIAVWGWGRLQQEISRYPEAIKSFHPDWNLFTGQIMDGLNEILRHLRPPDSGSVTADEQAQSAIVPAAGPQIATDPHVAEGSLDRHLHDQIDTYRDLIRADRPRTALELLFKLKEQVFADASAKIKFRIVANIGAAQHRLAKYDNAADSFLEASGYSPDEVPAIANKIAALLIKQRLGEAHDLAASAFATHPENADIALQRMQARSGSETIEGLWSTLPAKLKNDANLIGFRLAALREDQRFEWRQLAVEAAAANPDSKRLQLFKAESILERIISADRSMLGAPIEDGPSQAELTEAAETLEAAWDTSRGLESPPETSFAHNGALLWKILRQPEKAARMLDSALALGLKADEAIKLRLSLYSRPEEAAQAIRLADMLSDTAQARIIRAELQIADNPVSAREIIAERASFTGRDVVPAAQVYVESLVKEGKFDEALAEAERLASILPDDPNGPLIKYRIKLARADADAEDDLDEAVAKVNDATDFPIRFLVCEALERAQRFDEVVDLLNDRVSTAFDSMALRSLVAAAANADRRSSLTSLLKGLSAEVRAHPFYRSARIALAIKTGDIREAEREIRSYLVERPRSLEMHLQLLHALFRQDKIDALKGEAARPAAAFDGSPADFMKLAQFKEGFGDVHEAYALAYATLLKHPNDPATSMGYVGVFLRPGHSEELEVSPSTVAVNMAVDLREADGKSHVYVIEPDPDLRVSPLYIASTHRIAQSLIGQEVDAEIAMPDETSMRIAWIKPKELHALHEVMENFQNVFPDEQGMERVRIDTTSADGMRPISERLRERHDAIETVTKLYDSGGLPLALAARSLGSDPVDTLIGFSSSGHAIRVCQGTHLEREAASAAIKANDHKGCVLDAVTLHTVRRLDLLEAVRSECGPVGIVDSTVRRWQQKIHELKERLDEPDLSLSWEGGKIYRTEVTVKQKHEALAILETDAEWIAANMTVLTAVGTEDPGLPLRQLMYRFGSVFVDELRAAQGSGRMLVSDDLMLRGLAQAEFAVPSTWLQPILMKAKDADTVTPEAYRKAIVAMIDTRFTFVSIDPKLLTGSVEGIRDIALANDFHKLASRLGGKEADLRSHLNVAFSAIRDTWKNKTISWTARLAIVGTLLGDLLKERPRDQMRAIVGAFLEFGDKSLGDPDFRNYIGGWVRGHFLDI